LRLPAHPVDDLRRGERPRMQPHAFVDLAAFPHELDAQRRADESLAEQGAHEVVARRPYPEGDLVDALDGGFEVDDRVDVARRDAGGSRPRIAPTRPCVQTRP